MAVFTFNRHFDLTVFSLSVICIPTPPSINISSYFAQFYLITTFDYPRCIPLHNKPICSITGLRSYLRNTNPFPPLTLSGTHGSNLTAPSSNQTQAHHTPLPLNSTSSTCPHLAFEHEMPRMTGRQLDPHAQQYAGSRSEASSGMHAVSGSGSEEGKVYTCSLDEVVWEISSGLPKVGK
jgi:hypothetical protein